MVEADHAGKDLVKEADTLDPKKYDAGTKINPFLYVFYVWLFLFDLWPAHPVLLGAALI